jgi:long-chain acyl-CoA synthetase
MLIETLLAAAARQPQRLAVSDDAGSYTYANLAAASGALAAIVSATTPRPVVGLLLPTSAGFVISFYATLWAGKSVAPINFLLGPREIAHVIADSGIDAVVTITPLAAKLTGLPLKVIDLFSPNHAPLSPPPLPQKSADDMAVLMYTSATSGLPKGVVLTYGNLQSDVTAAIAHARLTGIHTFLGILPLFHSTGMLATLLAPIELGSSVFYQARFNPLAVIRAIKEHQISIVAAVPSMYAAMARLKSAGPEDVKSLYAAISGGEPLPSLLAQAWQEKFGSPIYEGYGLTETIGPIAFNVPGHLRPGSVGRLIPGASAKIVDDDGSEVPRGQSGEVWLKGPMIMKGYFNLPRETADAMTADGYFKSGDLGKLDDDGYLHIVGRKKELIIVAGEKAVPREIEEVLMAHSAVAEAAVVGKKDPSRGEVVVAFVTPKEGQTVSADALRQACRDAGLPQWKIPREIFIQADLPRSPTGKVLKRMLVERVNAQA